MVNNPEYFENLPFIKVELITSIFENEIENISNIVMNYNLFERPLIKINRGFCLSQPKREIVFSPVENNKISTLEIKHNQLHFDPEREGSEICILVKLINKTISNLRDIFFNENFYNIIHIKLYQRQLKKKYLNIIIDNIIQVFAKDDIDIIYNDYKLEIIQYINRPIYIDFIVENDVINYIKFYGQNDTLINNEEEDIINKLLGLIYYKINDL